MASKARVVNYAIDRLPGGDRLVHSVGLAGLGQHERGDKAVSHDESNLAIEHLVHIGHDRRFVVPYLTMPVGCAAAFDAVGAIVFPARSDAGRRDPVDPYLFDLADLTK